MAGPNVIESEEHIFKMARELKRICDKLKVTFIFKSSFDSYKLSSDCWEFSSDCYEFLPIAES